MEETLISLIFLSAGLFMGWSLGANDAANIFGTAVMTRMIRFRTAAGIMAVMIMLGAVLSGSGPTETLVKLGAIYRVEEAFLISLSAALAVLIMLRRGLPVSTSQAIVGAIVGWNLHIGQSINWEVLTRIAGTWFFAPVLGAVFAMGYFILFKRFYDNARIHLIRMDRLLRGSLMLAGAFGAYSLGANNMANVMGVFVNSVTVPAFSVRNMQLLDSQQVLFMIGAAAVSAGVYTYSLHVMKTVGSEIYQLTPPTALIVVLASATVLFLFASQGLRGILLNAGLPAFPLVPVSQSQTIVGAVIGIGLIKGSRNLNFPLLMTIAVGWVLTPLASMVMAFFLLSFS